MLLFYVSKLCSSAKKEDYAIIFIRMIKFRKINFLLLILLYKRVVVVGSMNEYRETNEMFCGILKLIQRSLRPNFDFSDLK